MLLTLALAAALAVDTVHFPVVTSDNLEGRSLTLPRDFGGERNFVFVAFLRKQQEDIDTWMPFVKAAVGRTPNTDFYEIPTIRRMVAPMRWMINRGMKGGIDDRVGHVFWSTTGGFSAGKGRELEQALMAR